MPLSDKFMCLAANAPSQLSVDRNEHPLFLLLLSGTSIANRARSKRILELSCILAVSRPFIHEGWKRVNVDCARTGSQLFG